MELKKAWPADVESTEPWRVRRGYDVNNVQVRRNIIQYTVCTKIGMSVIAVVGVFSYFSVYFLVQFLSVKGQTNIKLTKVSRRNS